MTPTRLPTRGPYATSSEPQLNNSLKEPLEVTESILDVSVLAGLLRQRDTN